MRELPSGTVTFLFSDIEGSTRLLRELGDDWADVVRDHNALLREAFAAGGGAEVDRQGDAFFAVFPRARGALTAAAQAQRALDGHTWPGGASLRVRMGVHTGEPALGDEGYLGLDVVRAARICSAANGGQVLVSETTAALVRGDDLGGTALSDAGEHRLKDFDEPQRLWQLVVPGVERAHAPPRTVGEPAAAPALRGWDIDAGTLVTEALERVRSLELNSVEELGPRIERQVADALRRTGVAAPPPPPPSARPRRGGAAAVALGVLVVVLVAMFVLVKSL